MRDYAKVSPKFWTGETGQELARRGSEALVVALYLMTSPHSNMLGLYYQPILYIAEETGLTIEGATKGLGSCIEAGFCEYDRASKMVWVFEMAAYQIGEELQPKDLRCKGVQREYAALPNNPFLGAFFDRYGESFHMTERRQFMPKGKGLASIITSPLEAPFKPRTRTGERTEQEQIKPTASSAGKLPPCPCQELVSLYHEVLPELPAVRLMNDQRKRAMAKVWGWVLSSSTPEGERRATSPTEAIAWFRRYFERARENDFLMGRTPRSGEHAGWRCDLDFLLTDRGMKQVIEKTTVAT